MRWAWALMTMPVGLMLGALPGTPFGGSPPKASSGTTPASVTTAYVDAGIGLFGYVDAGILIVTTDLESRGLANFNGTLTTGITSGVSIGLIPSTTRGAVCTNTTAPDSATCVGMYNSSGALVLSSPTGITLDISGAAKAGIDGTGKFYIGASGTSMSGSFSGSATIDFAATTNTTIDSTAITATGAVVGAPCIVGVPTAAAVTGATFTCYVSASDQVKVRFTAVGTSIDPLSGTFNVRTFL